MEEEMLVFMFLLLWRAFTSKGNMQVAITSLGSSLLHFERQVNQYILCIQVH